jgi:hypothetical protein
MSRRARLLGVYVKASTANPTGWRPWNSRLSFYVPNSYPVPTTGRGRFLLQPGITGGPSASGGLAGVNFPNYASFAGDRAWRTQVNPATPGPVYGPPPGARMQLSFLGATNNVRQRRTSGSILPAVNVISATGASGSATNTTRQRRQRQPAVNSNVEGWSAQPQGPQSWQQYQQQQSQQDAQTGSMTGASSGGIVGYDASGNPIYSTPPAGLVAIGTDAQGNPIYGAAGSATAAAATTAPTSSILTEDSLGFGLPNFAYLGIGVGLVLILKRK